MGRDVPSLSRGGNGVLRSRCASRRFFVFAWVGGLIMLGNLALATRASAQLGAGVVAPQASPLERLLPLPDPQAKPSLSPGETPAIPEGAEATVVVQPVAIEGATAYSEAELRA